MALRSVTQKEFRLCSRADPSIDRANGLAELLRYQDTGDASILRFREGVDPEANVTWFRCRPLTAQALLAAESPESEMRQARIALQFSLIEVVNLDGEPWVSEPTETPLPGIKTVVSERAMDRLTELVGANVIREIGGLVILRARLNDVQKKGS